MTIYKTIDGKIPVIISVPHCGKQTLHEIYKRTKKNIVTATDLNTSEIAIKIYEKMGEKPYVIINNISRKYVDMNRPESDGAENLLTRVLWRSYHRALNKLIRDCKKRYGTCLLIDLHGNAKTNNLVQLGYGITINDIGKKNLEKCSLPYLNNKYESKSLIIGNRSLGYFIDNVDAAPSPQIKTGDEIQSVAKDKYYFNGGYTIRNYSSKTKTDCIQIELSADLRKPGYLRISKILANAIYKFYLHNYN